MEPLIKEYSQSSRCGFNLKNKTPFENIEDLIPLRFLRQNKLKLPEVSELDIIRHFTHLSQFNFSVDTSFYPLGSCTMKYNPKINEEAANLPGFLNIHPLAPQETIQGILELLYNFEEYLKEIFGFDAFTLTPAAGAQGELTGLLLLRAYHQANGESNRYKIIIPDSSHGTNPASSSFAGYQTVTVASDDHGEVDLEELKKILDKDTAGLMLTNPNTLGLFEKNILKIAQMVHDVGALLYYDGANANASLGHFRPGDLGFDLAHINLHKTFSAPHGGGGPGSGPVGVKKFLEPFLPFPRIIFHNSHYTLNFKHPTLRYPELRTPNSELSIGKIGTFHGNIGVIIRAYTYILSLGAWGLKKVAEAAVLNANYLLARLKAYYEIPFDSFCQHEFVISCQRQAKFGVRALDIAKRLLDYSIHPPTIYFPLIVKEAMMIEPTETESKQTLDNFAETMIAIAKECEENPEIVKSAPHKTPLSRIDEVTAARKPKLKWD